MLKPEATWDEVQAAMVGKTIEAMRLGYEDGSGAREAFVVAFTDGSEVMLSAAYGINPYGTHLIVTPLSRDLQPGGA